MSNISTVTITSKDRTEDLAKPYYLSSLISNQIGTVTIRSEDSEGLTNMLFGTEKVDADMRIFEDAAISDFLNFDKDEE